MKSLLLLILFMAQSIAAQTVNFYGEYAAGLGANEFRVGQSANIQFTIGLKF